MVGMFIWKMCISLSASVQEQKYRRYSHQAVGQCSVLKPRKLKYKIIKVKSSRDLNGSLNSVKRVSPHVLNLLPV